MKRNTNLFAAGLYSAPQCELLDFRIEASILETSLTSGSIEDGTFEEWGTL